MRKELKTYESPQVELIRFQMEQHFCQSISTDTLDDFDLLDDTDLIWDDIAL